jgi:flagellar protein FlbD
MDGGSERTRTVQPMIRLTRLSGSVFALNSDLIERVDATPDTVVTLVDGKKYVVTESLDDVVDLVRRHRGEVLALSSFLDVEPWPTIAPPRLGTVSELARPES